MEASHSTLTLQSNVSDWLPSSPSPSPSPVPMELGFFHQENDSVETITMDNHRRVSTSNVTMTSGSRNTRAGAEAGAGAGTGVKTKVVEDDIAKCISNLSLYDLLDSTRTPSSTENSSAEVSDSSEVEVETETELEGAGQDKAGAAAASDKKLRVQTSHRPPIKKLKSSLKLCSSSSQSSISSNKSVRFAPELTRVKRFDSTREPMTISNETSPQVSPLDQQANGQPVATSVLDPSDSFWFGTQLSKMNLPLSKSIPKFSLSDSDNDMDDSDSDFDLEYFSDQLINGENHTTSFNSNPSTNPSSSSNSGTAAGSLSNYHFKFANKIPILEKDNDENLDDNDINYMLASSHSSPTKDPIQIKSWILKDTNIKKFQRSTLDLNADLSQYLQGNNIKLHSCNSLNLSKGKLTGLIYVTNLSFEKFIEIKFSFNDWKDIHYVTASYERTITDTIDEFQFVIDLSSFVYFLKVKNLISHNSLISPLTIHLCCRYDVNGETYYDNNNYENYQVSLDAVTNLKPRNDKKQQYHQRLIASERPMKRSLSSDNFATSSSKSSDSQHPFDQTKSTPPRLGRRFSEDTDFFNSSPLKNVSSHNYTTTPWQQSDPKYNELIKSYCFYDPNSTTDSTTTDSNSSSTSKASTKPKQASPKPKSQLTGSSTNWVT